jgi:hypothetical protein
MRRGPARNRRRLRRATQPQRRPAWRVPRGLGLQGAAMPRRAPPRRWLCGPNWRIAATPVRPCPAAARARRQRRKLRRSLPVRPALGRTGRFTMGWPQCPRMARIVSARQHLALAPQHRTTPSACPGCLCPRTTNKRLAPAAAGWFGAAAPHPASSTTPAAGRRRQAPPSAGILWRRARARRHAAAVWHARPHGALALPRAPAPPAQVPVLSTTLVQPSRRASKCSYPCAACSKGNSCEMIAEGLTLPAAIRSRSLRL